VKRQSYVRSADGVDLCQSFAFEPRTSVARAKPDPILGVIERKRCEHDGRTGFEFAFRFSLTAELPLHHIINQA
jgi:hypothetical protein